MTAFSALDRALHSWPHWAEEPATVTAEFEEGLSNTSYLLDADGQNYVLKLKSSLGSKLQLKTSDEIRAQRAAAVQQLAPRICYVDPALRFIVSEYLPGTTWAQKTPTGDYLQRLSTLLKNIHSLRPASHSLNLLERSEHYFSQLFLTKHNNAALLQIAELREAIAPVFKRIASDPRRSMCHNDLVASNILLSNEHGLVALDWEYAASGSPYFDLATVCIELKLAKNERDHLLKSYGEKNGQALLADYCIVYHYLSILWFLYAQPERSTHIKIEIKALLNQLAAA